MQKNKKTFIETLSSEQKAKLKGMAHSLKPVVQIGNQGFSESVKSEIQLALEKHELIKIQLPSDSKANEKEDKQKELLAILPKHAHFVSRIGRAVILYLEKEASEQKIKI